MEGYKTGEDMDKPIAHKPENHPWSTQLRQNIQKSMHSMALIRQKSKIEWIIIRQLFTLLKLCIN
jgi:hypothetical protein